MRCRALTNLSLLLTLLGTGPSFASEDHTRRNVRVEWEKIEGATQYEVQVTSKEDGKKKPAHFKTETPELETNMKPGFYLMQIRAYDDRGVPGSWSPGSELKVKLQSVVLNQPKPGAVISAGGENSESVRLSWDAVPSADHYKISLRSKTSEWRLEKKTNDTTLAPDLPVGEDFEWNVVGIDSKGETGDDNPAPQTFEIKGPALAKPNIQKPLSRYVDEITWEAPAKATGYSYELNYRNPKTKKWQKVETKTITENKLKFDISRPTGRYRLKLQALADRREPSKQVRMDFETRGGFSDQASLQTAILRDSFTKPTNYYAIASYLLTQMQYTADNRDANTIPTFQALGGTGRLGLGYQREDSDWGYFGIADLSGFTINGQNFNFASAEGHITHKLEFGQAGLLLIGTGLFYKQLPIISGSQIIGFRGVGKVSDIGPHVGFTYWMPLTQRFGLQANARAYYTLMGSATDGVNTQPSLSYQYGLLGSYRLSQSWIGYAGYAFRHDEARYPVNTGDPNGFGSAGQSNSIRIDGNYLNLIFEVSF